MNVSHIAAIIFGVCWLAAATGGVHLFRTRRRRKAAGRDWPVWLVPIEIGCWANVVGLAVAVVILLVLAAGVEDSYEPPDRQTGSAEPARTAGQDGGSSDSPESQQAGDVEKDRRPKGSEVPLSEKLLGFGVMLLVFGTVAGLAALGARGVRRRRLGVDGKEPWPRYTLLWEVSLWGFAGFVGLLVIGMAVVVFLIS